MKYFNLEESEGKNRASFSKAERKAHDRNLSKNFKAYQKQLAKLESRISRQAWNFFARGFRGWGLHDGHLLSFAVGDGLDHPLDGNQRFNFNKQKAKVRILILNRRQTLLYSFVCIDIRRVVCNYPVQDPPWDRGRIGLLETYELTSVNKHYLSLEFLFSSSATLLVEFGRLSFKRQRVSLAESKFNERGASA
jgi:hypothetical protein